jgi:uncharacterized protein
MQRIEGRLVYSASDLNDDLGCRRLTWLEQEAARRGVERPATDAATQLIAQKGDAHEAHYLDRLRALHGDAIVSFAGRLETSIAAMEAADAATREAMASGAPVIYQGAFFDGTFLGRADFLRRVETPSVTWPWSYEVIDTKLALSAKASFVLQVCNYSEHVARLQGTPPRDAHLVLGSGVKVAFRLEEYAAYYRRLKRAFLARADAPQEVYPAEVPQCAICSWSDACDAVRERDEYLGLVASMRAGQIERLTAVGITSISTLATARDDQRPFGMPEATFETLRAQARLQARQRAAARAVPPPEQRYFYELLAHEAGEGFERLPEPDDGDLYFDMEGDPLYTAEGGLEYLFGVYAPAEQRYVAWWARDLAHERAAFEQFMDFVVERRARFPKLHVYHYAPYETTALRRLMGTYGSREDALDDLLRGQVFVDLFAVVRQALRISQPSYSIKKLEPFYGMVRATDVRRGDDSIVNFETWLAGGDDAILADIERYNEDDCRSTHLLHGWLLERRREHEVALGRALPWRPEPTAEAPTDDDPEHALAVRLLDGVPAVLRRDDLEVASDDVRLRWLLGHALHYHRREAKPAYWKMYDREENVDRLLEFDHEAIGGLTLRADIAPYRITPRQNPIYTYAFPAQQHNLGSSPRDPIAKAAAGTIVEIDDDAGLLRIKLARAMVPERITALIPGGPIGTTSLRTAIERVAQAFLDGALTTTYPAIADLLLRGVPGLHDRARGATLQPAAVTSDAIATLIDQLDGSYLFLQGPPGSGKSTTGGEAIARLLAAGKKVGIVSRSHAAVHNLLRKVELAAVARGTVFTGFYKHTDDDDAYISPLETPMIGNAKQTPQIASQSHQLAGGTPWLFAHPALEHTYDVLVIDEAGQLSIADAIACATAARNVVLLGDPLQLAQVSQGAHPAGTGISVLEHLLGDAHTVAPDRGVFLDRSFRMHPEICAFVSRRVYDDRLHAAPATATNAVASSGLTGSGLRYVPVVHAGNTRESAEEADAIADAVALLLGGSVSVNGDPARPFVATDIMIVTPYNAQRRRIAQTLAARGLPAVAVGTVDKFQGQEAAVVFYSMATSSTDDMPRDMSFLFEKNRLNVAVSRAQCISVLVCSPELLEARCSTPAEIALASLLCDFVERATMRPTNGLTEGDPRVLLVE